MAGARSGQVRLLYTERLGPLLTLLRQLHRQIARLEEHERAGQMD